MSLNMVFTEARRFRDVTTDALDNVTRCVMTLTATSVYLTVSASDCIADHVASASHFKPDVELADALSRVPIDDVMVPNDVTALSRCHSNVL